MKFWCTSANSSKQRKSNHSLSSPVSYATISSIPIAKSDSGFSETRSNLEMYSYLEQILIFERIYHKNLKEFIIKYSRPLRRFLNSEEIVELFQNIEKICAISESIVRQCEKLFDEDNSSQSWIRPFGVMIDSYNTYISRSLKAQIILKQCENKISYFLQMPVEYITREITEFILLPIQHICLLNDLFQSANIENSIDWNIIQNIRFLSKQANHILQSELSPIIVHQRTDREPWESKRLEMSDSRLLFTQMNRTSNIHLSNVLHIEQDYSNTELHLIIAPTTSKSLRYSSIKMKHVYIRFQDKIDSIIWYDYLINAIQQAKDQSWSETNEVIL